MATLGNPKNTIAVLQKYQFNFQKKFGQNFLIDTGILEEIIEAAQITKDDFVDWLGFADGDQCHITAFSSCVFACLAYICFYLLQVFL